jgi:dolichol-phosphate mannosyltransferase
MKEAKISVIIPVFNEALNIEVLYSRLKNVFSKIDVQHELIFVNDNSRDTSLQIIKVFASSDKTVKYIDFSRNFGHQVAVSAGLEYCTGDYIAIIDADLQDPPELIIDMYEKINEGFDVVYARRRSRKDRSIVKKAAYKIFYKILAAISQIEIPLDTGDFRMMKKMLWTNWLKCRNPINF